MKFSLVQMETVAYEKERNIEKAFSFLEEAAKTAEVIVLPEMWTIGYGLRSLEENAEEMNSPLIERLKAFAKKKEVYLVPGSLPIKEGHKVYNRSLLLSPKGELLTTYDKLHMFSLLNEPKFFTAGGKVVVSEVTTETGPLGLGLSVCYDLRFPEMYRTLTRSGAQVVTVPAQWPESRLHAWRTLNQARAIENQIYICAVNGVGTYKDNVFGGHSMFISPVGDIIVEGGQEEEILYADFCPKTLASIRSQMAIWEDLRLDVYGRNY